MHLLWEAPSCALQPLARTSSVSSRPCCQFCMPGVHRYAPSTICGPGSSTWGALAGTHKGLTSCSIYTRGANKPALWDAMGLGMVMIPARHALPSEGNTDVRQDRATAEMSQSALRLPILCHSHNESLTACQGHPFPSIGYHSVCATVLPGRILPFLGCSPAPHCPHISHAHTRMSLPPAVFIGICGTQPVRCDCACQVPCLSDSLVPLTVLQGRKVAGSPGSLVLPFSCPFLTP